MRLCSWVFLVLFLNGCATTTSVNVPSIDNTVETSFQFNDERSEQQKISYEQTDATGKNIYFGDDKLTPTGPQLLKGVLKKNLNLELTGRIVVLTDFLVIISDPTITIDKARVQSASASVKNGAAVAPLAEALVYGIEGSKKNVYIRITGKVGEEAFSNQNSKNFWAGASEADIKFLLNKTLDDSVKEIKDILAKK